MKIPKLIHQIIFNETFLPNEITENIRYLKNNNPDFEYKFYDKKGSQMSDINMIKMICHYFSPQVEVIDNKYITNIKCNLWCKHDDIQLFLAQYKTSSSNTSSLTSSENLISFDDLYQSYKIYFNAKATVDKKTYPIVSKQFFEKFILTELTNHIKFEKFVSSEWL